MRPRSDSAMVAPSPSLITWILEPRGLSMIPSASALNGMNGRARSTIERSSTSKMRSALPAILGGGAALAVAESRGHVELHWAPGDII